MYAVGTERASIPRNPQLFSPRHSFLAWHLSWPHNTEPRPQAFSASPIFYREKPGDEVKQRQYLGKAAAISPVGDSLGELNDLTRFFIPQKCQLLI